jgi:hypothetical protein
MFFRVLGAMLTADAVDRHVRGRTMRATYAHQRVPGYPYIAAPLPLPALPPGPPVAAPGDWDPQAPERPVRGRRSSRAGS